jgi:hypothetical protein
MLRNQTAWGIIYNMDIELRAKVNISKVAREMEYLDEYLRPTHSFIVDR